MVSKIITLILLLLLTVSSVSALTASMVPARMVVREKPDVEVEKFILVKNVNNVSVTIEMFVAGDLENNVKIRENNFTLSPGEDKKAYFTIKADEEGTYTTKINFKFIPEKGNTVGLASTITFVAGSGEGSDSNEENEEDVTTNINEETNKLASKIRQSNIVSPLNLLLVSTIALAVILIVLFAYSLTKHKKRAKLNE